MLKNSASRVLRAPTNAVLAVLLAAVLATGCASVGAPQQATTLTAFEQLSVQPDGTRTWRQPTAARPSEVQLDIGAIAFGPGVFLDDTQRQTLRGDLFMAFKQRFEKAGVRVVSLDPASAAPKLRATITAVDLASPGLNAVTTVLLFAPLSRGGMTVEIEALDGKTDQRVAALAFAGRAGVQNIGSAFSALGHARVQSGLAADRFVALLLDLREKAPA